MEEAYRWDDYFERVQKYLDSGRLDPEELAPKRALERVLEEMRAAVLAGKRDWADVMKKKDFRLYFPIYSGTVDEGHWRKWFLEDPSRDALHQLWAAGDGSIEETADRIRAFAPRMPAKFKGAGVRMRPISVLLMALGAERHPPFMTTKFKETYEDLRYPFPREGRTRPICTSTHWSFSIDSSRKQGCAGSSVRATAWKRSRWSGGWRNRW